jgi:hypothetical protein
MLSLTSSRVARHTGGGRGPVSFSGFRLPPERRFSTDPFGFACGQANFTKMQLPWLFGLATDEIAM